jgi:trypsin-like peptidase/tetratricopeptide repeat protein
MSTSDIVADIRTALGVFDYRRADELADLLGRAILASDKPQPGDVPKVLSVLRQKGCFTAMTRVADALIQAGQGTATVRRQYAQALIEQKMLVPAEDMLVDALATYPSPSEEPEFRGLLGRVFKQRYVNAPEAVQEWRRKTLQQAIDWYMPVYTSNRAKHYWHGINVVALLERGARDGIAVSAGEEAGDIAEQVLAAIAADDTPVEQVYAFRFATEVEALVALGRYREALDRLREYVLHPGSDAFELGSTLRQFVEVWQLTDGTPPGGSLLPVLRSRLLFAKGGSITLEAARIPSEIDRLKTLEKVHGFDSFHTLGWYRDGLDRCRAIARIDREDGRGIGTGWLVRASELFDTNSPEPLLVTNAHVVSGTTPPFPKSLRPVEAVANFQIENVTSKVVGDVVWTSPVEALDCTVLRLVNPPPVTPLPIGPEPLWDEVPPIRLYIIGHPGGRDLEFSLQDNQLVECDAQRCRISYRTPTEGGSSGSPVFDSTWHVVGLHHAGDDDKRSGNANEGITLTSINAEARKHAFLGV